MNIGAQIKTKFGSARIIEYIPKEHPKHEERYMIKLDDLGYYHPARTHYPMGKPVHYEAGILFLWESDFEVLKYKQTELF